MLDGVRGKFTVSSDAYLLNFETICELLKDTYWAGIALKGRSLDQLRIHSALESVQEINRSASLEW